MTDYRSVKPEDLPRPTRLVVDCPDCGQPIEYEPFQDDSGAFYPHEEWPVCHGCEVLIDVPGVAIRAIEGEPYDVRCP